MTRGFPQGQATQVFPSPVAPGSSLPEGPDLPFAGWRRALPRPEASKLPIAGWPEVSPEPGGSEFPPRRWRRAPPCPKARICPLPGWLGVSPLPVARGFPFAGYRPGGRRISTPIARDRTRGFGQQFQDSLAVHKPSTVNPRLSPATGLSPPNTPQDDPQGGCLPGGGPVSPGRGSGRQI